jgi:hypothetical protein
MPCEVKCMVDGGLIPETVVPADYGQEMVKVRREDLQYIVERSDEWATKKFNEHLNRLAESLK